MVSSYGYGTTAPVFIAVADPCACLDLSVFRPLDLCRRFLGCMCMSQFYSTAVLVLNLVALLVKMIGWKRRVYP